MEPGQEPTISSSLGDNLTGFAAVEEYLRKHDSGWVKDFSDDIDTLLVFAGLFSAVLTAFAVETYTLLQQDSSDTTNQLLESILSRLDPSSSTSLIATPIPPSFTPSTTARWINTLFFLSLVLSLAAALFGILAKQWLREYMQWNSTLGAPRENVLVRQIRFESWQTWNVAATISSIPALLEVAMILFLAGIAILLWTLDAVVALVITATVAAFMAALLAFTVLPIFFRRCPYKSPTAWACVVFTSFLAETPRCTIKAIIRCLWIFREWVYRARGLYRRLSHNLSSSAPDRVDDRWRRRCINLGNLLVEHFHNLRRDSGHQSQRLLFRWRYCIDHIHWSRKFPDWRGRDRDCTTAANDSYDYLGYVLYAFPDDDKRMSAAIQRAAAEGSQDQSGLVFRALSWVYQASQDNALHAHVLKSFESLGQDVGDYSDSMETFFLKRVVSNWMLVAQSFGTWESPNRVVLEKCVEDWVDRKCAKRPQANVRAWWKIPGWCSCRLDHPGMRTQNVPTYLFLSTCLAMDIRVATEHLRHVIQGKHALSGHGTVILTLLHLQHIIGYEHLASTPHYDECIRTFVCDQERRATIDDTFPGLRSTVTRLAATLGVLECNSGIVTWMKTESDASRRGLPRFVCNFFSSAICYYNPEDIQIFIFFCQILISPHNWASSQVDTMTLGTVLAKMADFAEFAVHARIVNCGHSSKFQWPEMLDHLGPLESSQAFNVQPDEVEYIRLIHALARAYAAGLLPDTDNDQISRLEHVSNTMWANMREKKHCPPHANFLTRRVSNRAPEGAGPWVKFPPTIGTTLDRPGAVRHVLSEMDDGCEVTQNDAEIFVNVWRWCSSRQTGESLNGSSIPLFLASLPDAFALKFYPHEHSVHDLLRGLPDDDASNEGSALTSNPAADMKRRLLLAAQRWDCTGLEQGRDGFIRLCREICPDSSSQGVSFERMVTLIANHLGRTASKLGQPVASSRSATLHREDIGEVALAAPDCHPGLHTSSGESQTT